MGGGGGPIGLGPGWNPAQSSLGQSSLGQGIQQMTNNAKQIAGNFSGAVNNAPSNMGSLGQQLSKAPNFGSLTNGVNTPWGAGDVAGANTAQNNKLGFGDVVSNQLGLGGIGTLNRNQQQNGLKAEALAGAAAGGVEAAPAFGLAGGTGAALGASTGNQAFNAAVGSSNAPTELEGNPLTPAQQAKQAAQEAARKAADQKAQDQQQSANTASFNQANGLEDALRAAYLQRRGGYSNANGYL